MRLLLFVTLVTVGVSSKASQERGKRWFHPKGNVDSACEERERQRQRVSQYRRCLEKLGHRRTPSSEKKKKGLVVKILHEARNFNADNYLRLLNLLQENGGYSNITDLPREVHQKISKIVFGFECQRNRRYLLPEKPSIYDDTNN